MATTTRTVAHALFDYTRLRTVQRDVDGKLVDVSVPWTATAVRGEVIEVNDADLERGERHGALVEGPLPVLPSTLPTPPATPEVAGGSAPAEHPESATGLELDPSVAVHEHDDTDLPSRPKTVAKREAWEEYAVARGMSREEAESLTKDELIERFPPA